MNRAFRVGQLVAGKYRVRRWLAGGGMGAVWEAEHVELGLTVALKSIRTADGDTTTRTRFRREARAAAALRTPHVVRVFDYGLHEGQPYLVMELLEGEDLKDRLLKVRRLPVARAVDIVCQVAAALDEAHGRGLVHRDIKPRNIFLATEGGEERVKLLDFGVAKDLLSVSAVDETMEGALVGSPRYMSPEQVRGDPVDGRTDLWSLGVVLFEMLAGNPPFAGRGAQDVLARILRDEIPSLSEVSQDVPSAFDAALAMALERDVEKRCSSAREFAEALCRVGEDTTGMKAAETLHKIFGREQATLCDAQEVAQTAGSLGGVADIPRRARPRRYLLLAVAVLATLVGLGMVLLAQTPRATQAELPALMAPARDAFAVRAKFAAPPVAPQPSPKDVDTLPQAVPAAASATGNAPEPANPRPRAERGEERAERRSAGSKLLAPEDLL